ncbi:MAG: aspartyl protease family protein [Chloroflexi bacterium]|nr:aspartyl protease family protein [Chloroflexota bacterium]
MSSNFNAGHEALLAGRLTEAQGLLEAALAEEPGNVTIRTDLGWAYYRANDFARAARHAELVPGFEAAAAKLRSFGDEPPYELSGARCTRLPFVMLDPLPVVKITVEGVDVHVLIDTGGAELILDTAFASEIGVRSYGSQEGTFAGRAKGSYEHGRAQNVTLGDIELRRVPVVMLPVRRFSLITTPTPLLIAYQLTPGFLKAPLSRLPVSRYRIDGIIGTNLLAQFRATLDYPGKELVLERDSSEPLDGTEVPFVTHEAHQMISRDGWLNGVGPLRFFVDSGLAGAGFTCPRRTLERVGIAEPEVRHRGGMGGGGPVRTGRFKIGELGLGSLRQQDVTGTYIEPVSGEETEQEQRRDGIISHTFLRNYRWTIDARRSVFVFGLS